MIEITEPGEFDPKPEASQLLGDGFYNFLKYFVQLFLPFVASAYFFTSEIVDLPNTEIVLGFMAVTALATGLLIWFSTLKYKPVEKEYDGRLVIITDEEGNKMYSLELNDDPVNLVTKKAISFKVHPEVELKG